MIRRSLAWMALAQVLSFALQFSASVILARYLTPYEMGIYAVAAATVGVLSILRAFGLQTLIVREKELTADVTATAFTINIIISLLLSAGIVSLSFLGGAFFADAAVTHTLLVLAAMPLFGIFDFLPSASLERHGQFKAMALIATASGIVTAALTIGLAICGYSYLSIAYAGWGGQAVNVVLMNIVGRKHVNFKLGLDSWRRVSDFGFQMLAVSGVNSVAGRLSDVAVGRILGISSLGIYNRASGLNGLIWSNIHLVVGRVVFVDYAELSRRGLPLRDRYLRTVSIVTAFLWPAFAGFAILSGPMILNVYGQRWLPAASPLVMLAIASIIQVMITMTWELFAATGELKAQTKIEFIRAIFALSTFVGGCFISLTAAAGARVVDALFAVALYRPHIDRMTQTQLSDFIPIYLKSAAVTASAIAPAFILMARFGFAATVPIAWLMVSVISGAFLWVLALFLFNHPLMEELAGMVKRLSPVRS